MIPTRRPSVDYGAELARLAAAVESLAQAVVEQGIDIRELQAQRKRPAPPGVVPLKRGAAATSVSYATARRLCISEGAAIGAVRVGGYWYVDQAKLIARVNGDLPSAG